MTRSWCPHCGSDRTYVKDVQQDDKGIRRRRECNACGWRYTTVEVPLDELTRLQYADRDYKELLGRVSKSIESMRNQNNRRRKQK
jgi:transcriptional regulator NrdR family protein